MIIGYTSGVYDLFHIGHLNMLRNAKSMCDKLIVGVTTDELVSYKLKKSVIPFTERIEIVRSLNCVDVAIPQTDIDKVKIWNKLKFNILFVGDDWYNDKNWKKYESQLKKRRLKLYIFPIPRVYHPHY